MRRLIEFIILVTMITSCGGNGFLDKTAKAIEKVGQVPRHVINTLLGTDSESDEKLESLEDQVDELTARLNNILEVELNQLNQSNQDLAYQIQTIVNDVNTNETNISILANQLQSITNLVNNINTGLAEIIDPCGDDPYGYDDILIRLPNGTLIGVIMNEPHAFYLTVIEDGYYVTSDYTNCHFTVNNGQVSY
jgi:hypothetical protein